MTKEQVMEILEKYESCNFGGVVYKEDYDKMITEIISLHETGQTDVVIDPEKEMLDGYNQEPIPGVNG